MKNLLKSHKRAASNGIKRLQSKRKNTTPLSEQASVEQLNLMECKRKFI